MILRAKGLVIRTVDLKEADRLITLFTEQLGVITAIAKGARSFRSRQMAATQQFCYADFSLYQKGELYFVKEADLIDSFFGLRSSIDGLALASYICEVLSDVAVAEAEEELLRLSLNSLYAIANDRYCSTLVKAAFELRCAAIIGFMPEVLACHHCDQKNGDFFFDIMDGRLLCADCHAKEQLTLADTIDTEPHYRRIRCVISAGAKVALGYVVHCPIEKIFSFRIGEEDMRFFSAAAENYLLNQLERSFKTLDFYKQVTGIKSPK